MNGNFFFDATPQLGQERDVVKVCSADEKDESNEALDTHWKPRTKDKIGISGRNYEVIQVLGSNNSFDDDRTDMGATFDSNSIRHGDGQHGRGDTERDDHSDAGRHKLFAHAEIE